MVEVVLDRCQHIIGFSPEAQVDISLAGRGGSFLFWQNWDCMTQVSIGEVLLLCKEIRETLIDLTVENRLTLREFKTVGSWF